MGLGVLELRLIDAEVTERDLRTALEAVETRLSKDGYFLLPFARRFASGAARGKVSAC